jgi:hypothetical protein
MARITVEGARAAAQNADVPFKTEQKLVKTWDLLAGAVQKLVRTKFIR